ncbi:MAG: FAD-binding oxidoreductase [Hyphomicrobiaceae bacterium]|nr:FAD-binding oxidoreductase [Hyphomicrobiaceae bacterium]MCC0023091.1 FAD-binding oxidoreductase [Hyphomicrobiaceae bacterium]
MTVLDLNSELSGLLGAENVLVAPERMQPFLSEPRRRFHQSARAVVTPRSVEYVQALVAWANTNRQPLVPQSGNTGLVGGQVPLTGTEVVVSARHLNRVLEVNAGAGHISVEAGLTLQQTHEAADAAGALFPLTIASQGSAMIGGILSSNAGGVQVLSYGNARELCLGVDVVLPNGELMHGLNSLRKNNTGYDLKDLFVGAEGTLGIVVAATLKLFPKPEGYETAFISVADPEEAFALFEQMRERLGTTLTAFELMPRFGVDMLLKHGVIERDPAASISDWYVLAEVSRARGGRDGALLDALEGAFESGLVENAAVAQSESDRENMWKARESMSDVQSREGASIKHDVSVPLAAVPELVTRGIAAAKQILPGIRPCPFGHMGDGNLHFNFSQPAGADPKAFMAGAEPIHEAIYAIVTDLGGSVSAEHGIGQLKTHLLQRVKDPVAYALMKQIKAAIDPNNIMNPGKVFDL